jgi:signal transduction histidine kinase
MEAGREVVRNEQIELSQLVGEVVAICEPLALEKGIRFHAPQPEGMDTIETDPRKVRQILGNLLGNAVKFTDQGEIEFTTWSRDGSMFFQVRDTGIGMSAEQIERIFEPFWQAQQVNTREVGGVGLGLSVTRELTRLLGGEVTVESTPGKGSTFTVSLPATPST